MLVEPQGADAFTIFAQSIDRSGYARGTLAVREGLGAGARARPASSTSAWWTWGTAGIRRERTARTPRRPARRRPSRRDARCRSQRGCTASDTAPMPPHRARADASFDRVAQRRRRHAGVHADPRASTIRASGCATTAAACSLTRTCARRSRIPTAARPTARSSCTSRATWSASVVVRRRAVLGRRAARAALRRARPLRARQRHDDGRIRSTCTACGATSRTTPASFTCASTP